MAHWVQSFGICRGFCCASFRFDYIRSFCYTLIASFMRPAWGLPKADRTQVDPILATWTWYLGYSRYMLSYILRDYYSKDCLVASGSIPRIIEYVWVQSFTTEQQLQTPDHKPCAYFWGISLWQKQNEYPTAIAGLNDMLVRSPIRASAVTAATYMYLSAHLCHTHAWCYTMPKQKCGLEKWLYII